MRSNPFYALSAFAMLLGDWLLGQALHLEAGHVAGLLVLIAVLQLYEAVLIGAGAWLVCSGRAPRDGTSALLLETVFLCDAPLLAAECVTASLWVGTVATLALLVLAATKLAWVRRNAPGLLDSAAARLLGAHAAFVLLLPVVAAHLAAARLFGPAALYGLWWTSLLLPAGRRALLAHTVPATARSARVVEVWTWVPAVLALLHLWSVGYIHSVDFRPAFLAPLLLGFAVAAAREQLARQVVLPSLAVLVSIGQSDLFRASGGGHLVPVTPLQLAVTGAAAAWTYLAWRDRARWLAILAGACALAGLPGGIGRALADALARLLRGAGALLPGDAFGWGALTVIAAFVFLAAALRRSLDPGTRTPPRSRNGFFRRLVYDARDLAALALGLTALFASVSGRTLAARPFDHPQSIEAALLAAPVAAIAIALALRAHRLAASPANDAPGRRLAGIAIVAALGASSVTLSPLVAADRGHRIAYDERTAIATLRDLASEREHDFAAARSRTEAHGYTLTETRGTQSVAWTATPVEYGYTGLRAFCADSTGVLRVRVDGREALPPANGVCSPASWTALD